MKLLTKELEQSLPALYSTESTPTEEKTAVCKFFTPDSSWTWYAVEYDPEEKIFFGLVIGMEKGWGNFSLYELEAARGPLGLAIERDTFFKPTRMKDLYDFV